MSEPASFVEPTHPLRKPEWLRKQLSSGSAYADVQRTLRQGNLTTVCSEARCPNLHECWDRLRTATFMILGDICTRNCRFCSVKSGRPAAVQSDEPRRVATAAAEMKLRHVVVTMVTRDDLPDGGAMVLAETVRQLRISLPCAGVEVLCSDFGGNERAIQSLVDSAPEILGHNLETVRRLTPQVRSRSTYQGSLDFLACCRELRQRGQTPAVSATPDIAKIRLKSSLMLGLGEEWDEILQAMDDLRAVGVDMLNLGQYLQPGRQQLPVLKYWTPEEFVRLRDEGQKRGFSRVESGPLVRSSYHAEESAQLGSIGVNSKDK